MKRLFALIGLLALSLQPAWAADSVNAGDTSVLVQFKVQDSSSTTGAGLTGLDDSGGAVPTCYYHRSNSASATSITLANMTAGTWVSGGFQQIDATNMPGWYQMGVPDAAFAAGARDVAIQCKGATNMAQMDLHIPIYTTPTVLISDGTGAGQIDTNAGAVVAVTTATTCTNLTTNNDKTGYRLSATGVDDVWDEATSGHAVAGTTGKAVADAATGTGGGAASTFRAW